MTYPRVPAAFFAKLSGLFARRYIRKVRLSIRKWKLFQKWNKVPFTGTPRWCHTTFDDKDQLALPYMNSGAAKSTEVAKIREIPSEWLPKTAMPTTDIWCDTGWRERHRQGLEA